MSKNTFIIPINIVYTNLCFNTSDKELVCVESIKTPDDLIDINGEDYLQFIGKIKKTLEDMDYLLNDEHQSNRTNSTSMYYEFLKFNEDASIKVVVFIRISNHDAGKRVMYGKDTKNKQRMSDYIMNTRIPQLKQDFGDIMNEKPEILEIILDNQHFVSYDDALQYFDRFVKSRLYRHI